MGFALLIGLPIHVPVIVYFIYELQHVISNNVAF